MKRIPLIAAIAAVALTGMNCTPASSDVFPMSVGSVWKMDVLSTSVPTIGPLDTIETVFKKNYSAPTRDFFEMSTHVRLMNMIADFYKADGQPQKAAAYQKKAADLEKRVTGIHKNDR